MRDALAQLLASTNISGTGTTNGATFDTQTGTPRRGLKVSVLVTAMGGTSPTLACKAQHSDDGSTWTDLAICLTASITAVGEYFMSVETSKRYIRGVVTAGGTSPTATIQMDIVPSRP